MRKLSLVALLLLNLPALPGSAAETPAFHEPSAVVVNLTEADLNHVLRELFVSAGGAHLTGESERVSKGVFGLSYEADLSVPELTLGDGGRASLDLAIERADVRIDRLEGRIGSRKAHCENAGLAVDPERPLELSFALRFSIEGGGLRVIPESVRLDDARTDFRLIKPTRCENALLPRWLLWWIGKPQLRRRAEQLDEVLLARLRSGADDLNGSSGLLAKSWEGDGGETFRLYPRQVDTAGGSLLLTLAGGSTEVENTTTGNPPWVDGRRSGSFLALSGSLLDRLAELTFPEGEVEPSKPTGQLRKLFRSDSLFTLIPGVRGLDVDTLSFTLKLTPPRFTLRSVEEDEAGLDSTLLGEAAGSAGPRAALGIELAGVELKIWQAREDEYDALGTLTIDSGRFTVVPFFNLLGGISFELIENDWKLSSSGIAFNEHVLAATLQEFVFGEIFETRVEPLARGALKIGDVELGGGGFRVVEDYLIIEVGAAPDPAPTRTDSLLASR